MKCIFGLATGLTLSISMAAHAGRPYPQELVCPIGGEVFETIGTSSCSSLGHTMSLRAVTSCDFVTKLPVCPENGLPMYKDYTPEDIKEIEAYMKGDEYKDNRDKSKFYRAYLMDKALSSGDVKARYFALQEGIWRDETGAILSNKEYLNAYHENADLYLNNTKDEDGVEFYIAGQAFIYLKSGELKAAKAKFKEANAAKDNESENEYRDNYFAAVKYCLSKTAKAEYCEMNTPIRAHENRE